MNTKLIEEAGEILENALETLRDKEITPQQFIDATKIPLMDMSLELENDTDS